MNGPVYQAIVTRVLPPTNHRGTRIKAAAWAGSEVYPWDHSKGNEDNHMAAAKAFATKKEWSGQLIAGCLPNGDYCHVFAPKG